MICVVVLICLVHIASCDEYKGFEPTCLSRYDYDYKVLTKLVAMETEQAKLKEIIEREIVLNQETIERERLLTKEAIERERLLSQETIERERELSQEIIENLQNDIKKLTDTLSDRISVTESSIQIAEQKLRTFDDFGSKDGTGTTYTRWGKTSCPGNGTDMVYEGYAGGSWYDHSGGAAEYICLPKDPIWGHYEDKVQDVSARVYGAEYQLVDRNRVNFFGKELFDGDVPCAVCRTKRSSEIMIPGRNQCYDGWTREYHGYLTAGRHDTQAAASEYVCLDVEAESVPNSSSDQNGKLFHFAEASCGTLPCPPYVNGRELTCVVCSK